ncbi:Sulfhydryl oxidase 1 [Chlorella sorokiniana]|uniref:Sulfhydryl oxidase n=1 Tax=Chlorella sorokiniana TaxID=3076 RepID=A0A2P6TTP8_CHLSO|nr:Sulfhydryl oxidase 1 [Chlorella sorokiniana]|eukprot:PRW57447.1 Sulfhydryl oxidase 1 [Chlorella sorokiniana]
MARSRPRGGWLPLLAALLAAAACGAAEDKPGLLELTADSFVPTLQGLDDSRWVLMEFYAHWCPACQRFQPEYEKVAAFFAARGEAEPVVTVSRLDCANFGDMCGKFKVHGYPTMKLGLAADLAALALDKLTVVEPASRHANSVIAFLEKQLDAKFSGSKAGAGGSTDGAASGAATDKATAAAAVVGGRKGGAGLGKGGGAAIDGVQPHEHAAELAPASRARADLNDIEGATITSWQYLGASPLLLRGPEARQALKDWVELLADAHPVERCQLGAQRLRASLPEYWPDDADEPRKPLQGLQICPGSDFKDWSGCRGSVADKRGYTCGLWQLFHTLASRLPDSDNSGAVWLAAVKGFVSSYFQCSECAKHFVRHAGGEEAVAVARKRDAVLWMWRTHNIVNRRLGAEEAEDASKGDPAAPHVQFPPASLCPQCRRAEEGAAAADEAVPWDEDAVHAFLLSYYSGEAPLDAAPATGLRSRRSSWSDAGLVVVLVAACVYAVLRRSGQYALKKVHSRSL